MGEIDSLVTYATHRLGVDGGLHQVWGVCALTSSCSAYGPLLRRASGVGLLFWEIPLIHGPTAI